MSVWLLNDSAPVTVGQEFEAAASAKPWGWFGLPAAGEGSAFDAAAPAWSEHDWLRPLGYQMAAQTGGAEQDLILLAGESFYDEPEDEWEPQGYALFEDPPVVVVDLILVIGEQQDEEGDDWLELQVPVIQDDIVFAEFFAGEDDDNEPEPGVGLVADDLIMVAFDIAIDTTDDELTGEGMMDFEFLTDVDTVMNGEWIMTARRRGRR